MSGDRAAEEGRTAGDDGVAVAESSAVRGDPAVAGRRVAKALSEVVDVGAATAARKTTPKTTVATFLS